MRNATRAIAVAALLALTLAGCVVYDDYGYRGSGRHWRGDGHHSWGGGHSRGYDGGHYRHRGWR